MEREVLSPLPCPGKNPGNNLVVWGIIIRTIFEINPGDLFKSLARFQNIFIVFGVMPFYNQFFLLLAQLFYVTVNPVKMIANLYYAPA